MSKNISFEWYDYTIFVFTLALSTIIGIYHGFIEKKPSTANQYLLGGRKMKMLPIALSLVVSHISAVPVIAIPAEIYRYGGTIGLITCSMLIAATFTVFVALPVLYNLRLTSVYEYLERRFDSKTWKLCSFLYVLCDFMLFPIHAYGPSLAFATATGLNVQLVSFIMSAICVFYTAAGGFKTVIWTDILQLGIMIVYFFIISFGGTYLAGGFLKVWSTGLDGRRLDIFDFSLDLTKRNTFWCYIIGVSTQHMSVISVHQTGVQKFLSLSTLHDAKRSSICSGLLAFPIFGFCVYTGLLLYTTYQSCDPLLSKKIIKHDQLMPYYIASISDKIPGLAGFFISGLFCASLSTMSSNLNALSGVIYKNFVRLFLKIEHSETTAGNIIKIIVVVLGTISVFTVIAVDYLGDLVSLISLAMGLTNGPLLGVFILGLLLPRTNAKGAFYGIIGGIILNISFMVPSKYYQLKGWIKDNTKPLHTTDCFISNFTSLLNITTSTTQVTLANAFEVNPLFKISFYYYVFLGAISTIILGFIVSYMTEKPKIDKKLISSISYCLLPKDAIINERVAYRSIEKALSQVGSLK